MDGLKVAYIEPGAERRHCAKDGAISVGRRSQAVVTLVLVACDVEELTEAKELGFRVYGGIS